jgi:hypothetical protein
MSDKVFISLCCTVPSEVHVFFKEAMPCNNFTRCPTDLIPSKDSISPIVRYPLMSTSESISLALNMSVYCL